MLIRHYATLSEDELQMEREARTLKKQFYSRMGPSGFSAEDEAQAMDVLGQALERMEAGLDPGPWLLGGQLTIADFCVAPTIDRLEDPAWRICGKGATSVSARGSRD